MTPPPTAAHRDPYVGLRPFESDEEKLFFGRGEDIIEMLRILRREFFLAVIGSSGSGKSSLARAGLLPAIRDHSFLDGAGWDWRIVLMRPGHSPYDNLARALIAASDAPDHDRDSIRTILMSGSRGLLDAIEALPFPPKARLVVVADQFEEIFRFVDRGAHNPFQSGPATPAQRNEALAFIDMLLTTIAQHDRRVYTVLTMRSEYLGDCEAFLNLPVAISKCQYLTRRLTPEKLQDCIERPIAHHGGQVEKEVVAALLNAVGTDMDQLPRLQHVLLRMWTLAVQERGDSTRAIIIKPHHYQAVGGFENALSHHANQLYRDLGEPGQMQSRKQSITERMFRCLSERTGEGRLIRRLTSIQEVADVAQVEPEEVAEVVKVFIRSGCNFLVPTPAEPLTEATRLDISHESLLRQWDLLRAWIDAEGESAATFRRLLDATRRHQEGSAALWVPPDLTLALAWKKEQQPTAAWAARYITGSPEQVEQEFAACLQFLAMSDTTRAEEEARDKQAQEERVRLLAEKADAARQAEVRQRTLTFRFFGAAMVASALAVFALIALGVAISKGREAKREANNAQFFRMQTDHLAKQAIMERNLQRTTFLRDLQKGTKGTKDERILVEKPSERPYSAVCLLAYDIPSSNTRMPPQQALATGILIGPNVVLTSAFNVCDRSSQVNDQSRSKFFENLRVSPVGSRLATGPTPWTQVTHAYFPHDWRTWKLAPWINAVSLNGDGSLVLTGGADHAVQLWQSKSAVPVRLTAKYPTEVTSVALSKDGTIALVAGKDKVVKLLDIPGGRSTDLHHPDKVTAVAVSADGKTALTGCEDGKAHVWDTASGTPRGEAITVIRSINSVALSAYGAYALIGHYGSSVQLQHTATGTPIGSPMKLPADTNVTAIALSRDAKIALTADSSKKVRAWDTTTGKVLGVPFDHPRRVSAIAVSGDGQTAITGCDDYLARLWSTSTGKQIAPPVNHSNIIVSVALSDDGRIAVIGGGNVVRSWDISAGKAAGPLIRHQIDDQFALALLKLNQRHESLAGHVDMAVLTDEEWRTLKIELVGFPADKEFGSLWRTPVQIDADAIGSMKIRYSTWAGPGTTGAPLIVRKNSQAFVVGVHSGESSDGLLGIRLGAVNKPMPTPSDWESVLPTKKY